MSSQTNQVSVPKLSLVSRTVVHYFDLLEAVVFPYFYSGVILLPLVGWMYCLGGFLYVFSSLFLLEAAQVCNNGSLLHKPVSLLFVYPVNTIPPLVCAIKTTEDFYKTRLCC